MIARKITYRGNFNEETIGEMFDITRKNEITGVVKKNSDKEVELLLEGDPSMIKLIQHQIERKVKTAISDKSIEKQEFHYYVGVQFQETL
jgi:acylphosphatase